MGEALIQRKKNTGQKRERRGIWGPKQKEWDTVGKGNGNPGLARS